jgi:hypothetical protein
MIVPKAYVLAEDWKIDCLGLVRRSMLGQGP